MEQRRHTIDSIPFALEASDDTGWTIAADRIRGRAAPKSDLFIDPSGASGVAAETFMNARTLLGDAPAGDFTLEAVASVEFDATFDAGVLLVWIDDAHWGKLCFERSPDGENMVVSVVTRGVSDDANSFVVDASSIPLRISRTGSVLAFHAYADGGWKFVRAFSLPGADAALRIGFEVQSPTGDGCDVEFTGIAFHARTLGDLRDGS